MVNAETFEFSLQDILTIEYFLWKAKEQTDAISFSYPVNSLIIENKIFKKWAMKKSAAFAKLIASPGSGSFAFLSCNRAKINGKINSVNSKLETMVNYFATNNYLIAKGMFEEFYGM